MWLHWAHLDNPRYSRHLKIVNVVIPAKCNNVGQRSHSFWGLSSSKLIYIYIYLVFYPLFSSLSVTISASGFVYFNFYLLLLLFAILLLVCSAKWFTHFSTWSTFIAQFRVGFMPYSLVCSEDVDGGPVIPVQGAQSLGGIQLHRAWQFTRQEDP